MLALLPSPRWLKAALTSGQWAQLAVFAAAAIRFILLRPDAAMAQNISGTFVGGQFKVFFSLARLAAFLLAIVFAIWQGIQAVQGDTGGWLKMIGGFFVAVIAFKPEWVMNNIFGMNVQLDPFSFTGA